MSYTVGGMSAAGSAFTSMTTQMLGAPPSVGRVEAYGRLAMYVYVNYPNPHFTIHRDPDCAQVQAHGKRGQRLVRVRADNLDEVLADFTAWKYRFAAHSQANDLWLDISLETPEQEEHLVHVIQALVGSRYTPLADTPV